MTRPIDRHLWCIRNLQQLRSGAVWQIGLLWIVSLPPAFGQEATKYLHPATDPAHDLTTREFARDIASNFRALISTESIIPLVAGGAGIGLATIPEQRLERHFARGDIWGIWGDPGRYIGNPVVLAGIGSSLFVVSRRTEDRKFRSLSYSLVHGSIMSAVITQSSKAGFRRLRPNGDDYGAFPSGHAADSFMFATVFAEHYGWKAAVPAYAIAAYVAASRLEERKHHLTDVVAGSAIGYLVGRTVTRRMRGSEQSRFDWQVYPRRGGFTAVIRVALP
jgi:membrane-associated phospholipid phosphatase